MKEVESLTGETGAVCLTILPVSSFLIVATM